MLQAAFCLPDRREARTLSGRSPSRAGAAGRQEQRGRSGARHLLPVASDKPQPGCPWFGLQEVTLAAGPDSCGAGVMGALPSLSSCGAGLPWLHPRSERAGIGPNLPSWAKIGSFTQVPCFCKIVESVCVFVWRWPVLSTSEWVCVCSRSLRSCLRPSISEQTKLSPTAKRHFTFDFCLSENLPAFLVLNPGSSCLYPVSLVWRCSSSCSWLEGFLTENDGATSEAYLFSPPSRPQMQRWLWGRCFLWCETVLSFSPLTSTRVTVSLWKVVWTEESAGASFWKLWLPGHLMESGAPDTGRRGAIVFIHRERKGNLSKQHCRRVVYKHRTGFCQYSCCQVKERGFLLESLGEKQ